MIEETARVVECKGRVAWVETQRASTCGSCAANKGCGTAVLSRVLGQKRSRVRVLNGLGAVAGEQVIIGLHEQAVVRGALAIYLIPLCGLLCGALFGGYLAERLLVENMDLLTMGFGGFGFVLSVGWLRVYARRIREDERYQPVVLRRVSTVAPAALTPLAGGH